MKYFSLFLCSFAFCIAMSADAFADLVITGSSSKFYANAFADFSGNNFLGGFEVNGTNNVNQPFADTRTITSGDRVYTYDYNASNSYTVAGSQLQLSTLVSMNINATVPGAGEVFEGGNAFIRFKVDRPYEVTANFDISFPGTPAPRFERVDIFNSGVASYYQLLRINGSVLSEFGDKTLTYLLPPGEYEFGSTLAVRRESAFDFQDYAMSNLTTLTLTPVAVPEPSSMALLGCAGAFGLLKFRRNLKRQET